MLELLAIFYTCICMAITMDSVIYVLLVGMIGVILVTCGARGSWKEPAISMLKRKDNCNDTSEEDSFDQDPCSAAANCKSARKFLVATTYLCNMLHTYIYYIIICSVDTSIPTIPVRHQSGKHD